MSAAEVKVETKSDAVAKVEKKLTAEQLAEANRLKDEGNKLFSANDFRAAIHKFTQAIAIDDTNEVFYSNRSAASASLGLKDSDIKLLEAAVNDGKKCLELKPDWGKGYSRLAHAYMSQKNYVEAAKVYATGVAKDPTNQLLTDGLVSAQKQIKMQKEEEERGHVVGIDLGTTFSAVGVWMNDTVVMIPNDRGEITTPSWVSFTKSGKRYVGAAAKSQAGRFPHNTIYDVKRFIGQRWSDPGVQQDCAHYAFKVKPGEADKPMIQVDMGMHGKKEFAPEEISAMVLAYLKKSAEAFLKQPVTKAVITVPAYFNDSQRAATKAAGKIAGLEVMRIINEPTAAALSYGLDLKNRTKKKCNVLIFDLGGGTFDVSILRLEGGTFEVVSTGGDTRLGGEDFDLLTVKFLQKEAEAQGIPDFSKDLRTMKRFAVAAEAAKRVLSQATSADIVVEAITATESKDEDDDDDEDEKKTEAKKKQASTVKTYDFKYKMDRKTFEKINESFFIRCIETVKKVLKDGRMKPEDIDDIVLVGGSTRIPKVQEMLSSYFNGKDLCRSVNPDEAVAYGAAVQGAILNGKRNKNTQDLLLMDVTPLSLGIETEGRMMSVIIPRNTRIPCVKTQTYTTVDNFQTDIDVCVYEGERMKSDANNLLGKFVISGVEKAKRGEPKIDVSFGIDSNGILNVEAKDQKTGATNKIVIANRGRASDADVDRMVKEAEKFRRDDEARSKQLEARNELESLINESREMLLEDPTLGEQLEKTLSDTEIWLEENHGSASGAELNMKKRALNTVLLRAQQAAAAGGGRKGGKRKAKN